MKTLIYGAGPIGQWLALRLRHAGSDVSLLARNETRDRLERDGVVLTDGFSGKRLEARPRIVSSVDPDDDYDLVVVAMQRSNRLAVCPILARNENLKNILFLGNDIEGFRRYLRHLPQKTVLLGFPGAGGGWRGDRLVVMDRKRPEGPFGEIFIGEIDGIKRRRTWEIGKLFEAAGIDVHIEPDMDGWLKYHFAFMAPTAGAILEKRGDLEAVADDPELIHRYCRACREAANVLRKIGYTRRQPPIFNLYFWLPRWLEPKVFANLFRSDAAEIRFGLHARCVGPELADLADEFHLITRLAGMETPTLDQLLQSVLLPELRGQDQEVA